MSTCWLNPDGSKIEVFIDDRQPYIETHSTAVSGVVCALPTARGDVYRLLADLATAMGHDLPALVSGITAQAAAELPPLPDRRGIYTYRFNGYPLSRAELAAEIGVAALLTQEEAAPGDRPSSGDWFTVRYTVHVRTLNDYYPPQCRR